MGRWESLIFFNPPRPQIPALRQLSLRSFLLCPSSVSAACPFPAHVLPADSELSQTVGPVEFCPLSCAEVCDLPLKAALTRPSKCSGPLEAMHSHLKEKASSGCFSHRKVGVSWLIARHCSWPEPHWDLPTLPRCQSGRTSHCFLRLPFLTGISLST